MYQISPVKPLRTATAAPIHLTLANQCDRPAVDALRVSAYLGAAYFDIRDTTGIQTAQDPLGCHVLCAWEGAALLATVRLAVTKTPAEAADLLSFASMPRSFEMPAAVFSRGAVSVDARGQGWMPFLLTVGIRMASRLGCRYAFGAQAAGTPHQGAMLRAGWQVQGVEAMADESFVLKTATQFLWLASAGFGRAVASGLDAKGTSLLDRCGLNGLSALDARLDAALIIHKVSHPAANTAPMQSGRSAPRSFVRVLATPGIGPMPKSSSARRTPARTRASIL